MLPRGWVVTKLGEQFEIKNLGHMKYYLGMDVSYVERGLKLNQKAYIDDLLDSFGMTDSLPILH